MCSSGVLVTLVFNVNYLNWHIRDCSNFLMLPEVYINLAKVVHGRVERTAQVNVHDTLALMHV